MARIDRVQGDIVCVTLVGYEHALSVPGTWLRESARAEEAAHAAAPKIDDVPAGGVPAADDASAADDAPGADDVPAADEQGRRRDVEDASSARPDDAPLDPEQPWAPRTKDPEALRPDGTEDAATDGPAPASASSTAALEAAAAVVPPRSRLSRGADAPNPFPDVDDKYWAQRHHYFSLFDDGILLDAEGWFSVTPERVAAHIASRCGSCVVVDAFCGCGGNAIAFAAAGAHVVAIDIDEARLAYARHNARVYDVAHNIDFVHGDALQLLMSPRLRGKVDVVFLSPPWGGPDYLDAAEFDVRAMRVGDADGFELVRLAAAAAPNVIYFLPRTTTARVARDLAETAANTAAVELESNFLNGKIKAKTLYFGPLFDCAPADDGPRR
ncbi:RNA cap guanine-N2 methyltransferase-domain-containing protein [Pelagophyceae sp. CCMP2097]|nr:RNA cap guanine-N2 methyltransferase-domain-containing protein [Pelagophyceae sp. CCMP2097]|mmetsp:Transcript_16840/g.58617  ORF Transcript_16840/g.58617 Transcript_16840/m.58617 type:complete len:384 (+) Transcript_16840:88-1239(+)